MQLFALRVLMRPRDPDLFKGICSKDIVHFENAIVFSAKVTSDIINTIRS